jgi:uncharacterized membrane protein YcaP (DUF421 family)
VIDVTTSLPLLAPDWDAMFTPQTNLIELVVRGTVMYFVLLALLRITPRRTVGSIGLVDLVLIVFVAEAAGKALGGDQQSVVDAAVLVGTLVGWGVALDWLNFQVPLVARILSPPPLAVVRDGTFLRKNMRTEFITEDELMGKLREQGIDDVSKVRVARVEEDGGLSVLTFDDKPKRQQPKKKPG